MEGMGQGLHNANMTLDRNAEDKEGKRGVGELDCQFSKAWHHINLVEAV